MSLGARMCRAIAAPRYFAVGWSMRPISASIAGHPAKRTRSEAGRTACKAPSLHAATGTGGSIRSLAAGHGSRRAPSASSEPASGPRDARPRKCFRPSPSRRYGQLHAVVGRSRSHKIQNLRFYFQNSLTPINSHAIPCSPMNGCGRRGELRQHLSGAPCRASVGERWGKKWQCFCPLT